MSEELLDRATETVGNIISLEHVNVTIDRQDWATQFYVLGLGLTRDPYLMVGLDNMWINAGEQQFHLPTRGRQVLRGTIGLLLPDLDAAQSRLEAVADSLSGSAFDFKRGNQTLDVTCPWGNHIRCHGPSAETGDLRLGIFYVEFTVPVGTAGPIARFYSEIIGAPGTVANGDAVRALVNAGRGQTLRFREVDAPLAEYDGHHVAVYITDFAGPHQKLAELGLISRENGTHEYRFDTIIDLDSKEPLFTIEHEVRSLTHPIFARPLINRDPNQTQRGYFRGRDAFRP